MSIKVPNDRPLTDEERKYLLMRGEESRVKQQDERYPEGDAELDDTEALVEDDEEEGDGYDNWTVAELQKEIDRRNEDGAEISPSGTKKASLIAALRDDDESEADEEG